MHQLYSVHDLERLNLLEASSKILSFETILEIRRQEDIVPHGYVIMDRWAAQQPDELKQLESESFLHLFNHVYTQQKKELDVLLNPLMVNAESHLTTHERLAFHEINLRLIRRF
jgi:hypothetical protein